MRILSALVLPLFFLGCPADQPGSVPKESPPASTPAPTAQSTPSTSSVSEAPKVSFEGVWATKDVQGEAFDMVIFPNGQSVTTWSKGPDGAKGERGFWRKENDRLVSVYEDGWTDVLEPTSDGFMHKGYAPQSQIGGTPTNSATATKATGSAAMYTGIWRMNREPDGSYQYVALFSSGRASSTVNGGAEGKWEATETGVRCTWPKDGWVDMIEHGPDGWQKRSWVGPETETPADVSPVVRVGEEKFLIKP